MFGCSRISWPLIGRGFPKDVGCVSILARRPKLKTSANMEQGCRANKLLGRGMAMQSTRPSAVGSGSLPVVSSGLLARSDSSFSSADYVFISEIQRTRRRWCWIARHIALQCGQDWYSLLLACFNGPFSLAVPFT